MSGAKESTSFIGNPFGAVSIGSYSLCSYYTTIPPLPVLFRISVPERNHDFVGEEHDARLGWMKQDAHHILNYVTES